MSDDGRGAVQSHESLEGSAIPVKVGASNILVIFLLPMLLLLVASSLLLLVTASCSPSHYR